MNLVDRYIARTVGLMIFFAVLALFGILTLFTVLEQLEDIQNTYTLNDALIYTLLTTPRRIYEVLPYSALIGCLLGMGMLANNSELVVIRASGISTGSITLSVLKPVLVLVLIGLAVGEYLVPDAERIAQASRSRAMSDESRITPEFGFWYREGAIYMHFDELTPGGEMKGISHYLFNEEGRLKEVLFAERALYHDVSEVEKYWLMETVIKTEFVGEQTLTQQMASYEWQTSLAPDFLSTEMVVQPNKLSIRELDAKIIYMEEQGLNTVKYRLGYWQKLLQPLSTLGLVFVGLSFIFGPLRESTMGMRVVSGLVVGILFKFLQDLFAPASMVYGFSPLVATLIPSLVCFILGFWLLKRKA